MSYILEALRKAESERERGLIPGLNAQPLGPADGEHAPATSILRAWAPWAIAAVSVLLAGALGWTWRSDSAEQHRATAGPAAPTTVPDGATAPAVPIDSPAAPLPAPVATATLPPPVTATRTVPAGPRADVGPTVARSPVAALAPVAASATATLPPQPAAPGSAAGPAAAEQRIYTLAELPDAIHRDLPALSVAGASYSERASNRLLIVNGNVFHEGDRLAPDLVLERIDLKSAILRFKGVRFVITY